MTIEFILSFQTVAALFVLYWSTIGSARLLFVWLERRRAIVLWTWGQQLVAHAIKRIVSTIETYTPSQYTCNTD